MALTLETRIAGVSVNRRGSAALVHDRGRIVRLSTPGPSSLAWSIDGLTRTQLASDQPVHSEYGALAVGAHGVLILENRTASGGEADQMDAGVGYLPAQ